MKHEIITLANVQIIGMAKEIAFCKGQEECPKFWGEYVERIIKPVFMEHKAGRHRQRCRRVRALHLRHPQPQLHDLCRG